ncbi:hypothetical protein [Cytobacillus sp.]|uniref:hypothetical protein n=1 Tax=Cytobacillus sp. TaxID=2675269 RepID=UPI0028BD3EE1|nr:hypothetical protein [Cytobacillus sp.]
MDPLKNCVKKALDEHTYKNIELDQNARNRFIAQINQSQKRSKRKHFHLYPSMLAGTCALLLVILLFLPQLHSSSYGEEEVYQFVTEYKIIQYTIEDPAYSPTGIEISERVKDFLSEDAYKKQMANRFYDTAPLIAQQTNKSIALSDIKIEKEKEKENGMIDYNYTMKIQIYDNQSSKEIAIKGQLTIANDDELKITRDWEDRKGLVDEFFK